MFNFSCFTSTKKSIKIFQRVACFQSWFSHPVCDFMQILTTSRKVSNRRDCIRVVTGSVTSDARNPRFEYSQWQFKRMLTVEKREIKKKDAGKGHLNKNYKRWIHQSNFKWCSSNHLLFVIKLNDNVFFENRHILKNSSISFRTFNLCKILTLI